MFPKERYDAIIDMIESIVNYGEYEDAGIIASNVANTAGLGVRELSNIFNFLTGKSLNEYIKERQMNKSYLSLIEDDINDCQKAMGCTGYSEQSSYIKKFKQLFHATPQEAIVAHKSMETFLGIRPSHWDSLNSEDEDRNLEIESLNCVSGDEYDDVSSECKDEKKLDKVYGMDLDDLEEMLAVEAYRMEFGYSRIEANAAYQIKRTFDCDIVKAFEFIYEYELSMDEEYDDGEESLKHESYFSFAYFLIYLYNVGAKHNVENVEVYQACRELAYFGINPEKIEQDDIDYYFDNRTELAYFIPNYIPAKYGYKEIEGKYEDLTFYDFHGIVCEAGIENAFDIVDMDYEKKTILP